VVTFHEVYLVDLHDKIDNKKKDMIIRYNNEDYIRKVKVFEDRLIIIDDHYISMYLIEKSDERYKVSKAGNYFIEKKLEDGVSVFPIKKRKIGVLIEN
jgi:hypothetical protein